MEKHFLLLLDLGRTQLTGKWTVKRKRDVKRGLNFEMVGEEDSSWELIYALAQVCSGAQGRVTSQTPWFQENPEPRSGRMTHSNT